MKKVIMVAFGFLLSLNSYADYVAGTGWMSIVKITAADVQRFEVQGGTLCQTKVFTIDATQKGGKEQYAAVLAAASAGKKIFIETWVGCPSSTDASLNWGMKVGAITVQY